MSTIEIIGVIILSFLPFWPWLFLAYLVFTDEKKEKLEGIKLSKG